ncbi:MAG: dTMP kinase [DPANN group archaeon]|nr:dTMP kinase [DPANN group archaeon]
MRGKLIVIDGSDASGKKTQTQLLVRRLEDEGHRVKTMDFPRYSSFFGKLIARYLNGDFGTLAEVRPELASLLYALDRADQKQTIKDWLDQGNLVVLDRYTESNMGYQAAKIDDPAEKAAFIEWVKQLEREQLGIPSSDLVIYLLVPEEVTAKLIQGREGKAYIKDHARDIHEQDRTYQQKVIESYIELCRTEGWQQIDCTDKGRMLAKEAVAEKVWDVVKTALSSEAR